MSTGSNYTIEIQNYGSVLAFLNVFLHYINFFII